MVRSATYAAGVVEDEIREPTFLVLSALADGARHGYAVMLEVEQMSKGRVRLRTSTLYGILDRLAQAGLVADIGTEVVDGRARRSYALTAAGRTVLRAEVDRMRVNASEASRRLRSGAVHDADA